MENYLKCLEEINEILIKYELKIDISEWLSFIDKGKYVSIETDDNGLLVVQ